MVKKAMYVSFIFAVIFCCGQMVQAQKPSGELRIGLDTFYDQIFHPTLSNYFIKVYLEPIYDFIIGIDKDGKFDPNQSVAYKWESSPDLKVWTFYIRDGIKFHNGDPLTIEDVKFTIDQACRKEMRANSVLVREHVSRVEAIPPNKVVVYSKDPWPTILYTLSSHVGSPGMIQPKKYIGEKGEKHFAANPIGSGPYKFSEWKEGAYIKLVAQDSHWRVGVPKYQYLTFKLMPEEGTREAALRSAEVDVINIGLSRVKGLKDAGFTIHGKTDGTFLDLRWLQYWRPEFPTSDRRVRQALIYAVNKDEIIKQILLGKGKVVGTTAPMFTWTIEYKPYPATPYDPKLAKKLLAEAGYPNGFTIDMYSFATVLPETKLINEAIAGYWEAIGVKTNILEMTWDGAFSPVYHNKVAPPRAGAFVYQWPNRAVYSWRAEFHSSALTSHIKDPKLDRMIEESEAEGTVEGYITSRQKLMDYVRENFYGSGICTTDILFALSKKVPLWEMGRGISSFRWEYIGKE